MSSLKQRRSRTRIRTRTRPRAHTYTRTVDASSSPAPAKRRRLRHEPLPDALYAVKDIIDEKFVDGKRWFKINWADNPATGESFEPTWEPEENANQDAVDDWEWEKNRRDLLGLNKDHSPSTTEPSADNDPHSTQIYPESPRVYIELQSKSDFLKSRPDIDPAEVVAFTSSQLSQFPPSDSDSQLPPSQFFIISSQPSQDIVIADSQPLSIAITVSQQAAPSARAQGISQTTIPDSQDFSTDFSQDPIEVPCTIGETYRTETDSTKESQHTVSASSIPSRQPDGNLVSFGNFSISTDLEHNQESQENPAVLQPMSNLVPPSIPESFRAPFSGFLTQSEFHSGEFSLSAKSLQQPQTDEAAVIAEDRVGTTTAQDTALDDSHQPAQRVLPFYEEESHFLTQSEPEFFSASEGYESVPPTSQRNSGASEQRLVPSQDAILPATRNCTTLNPPIHNAVPPLAELNDLRMDDSQPIVPERSALDELRAVQMQFLAKPVEDSLESLAGSAGHNTEEGRGHNIPPTPVSPSDIINSVERDGLDTLNQAQIPPVVGTEPWTQAPGPMLFTGPLDPHLGPSAAAESNTTSLATTTPASGAIDRTSDVDMAFTAAALNSALEPGLEDTNHVPATITPSELLAPTASSILPGASFHPDQELETAMIPTEGPDVPDTVMEDGDEFGILPSEDTAANEYIIALPPPARNRAETFDILNKTHREDIEKFKMLFSQDPSLSPDHKVVTRIDLMLQSLAEMSNLPAYHKDLAGLSQESWVRYARDTCSKLAFLYEFLNSLRATDVEVAILAATGPVMDKIEAIVSHGGLTYHRADGQERVQAPPGQASACKVVLVDTAQRGLRSLLTANILIAYDESAETSGMLRPYKTSRADDQIPLIFSLMEVYSLEHINRRLSPNLKPLERKLAQVRCLVSLSRYADDEGAYEFVPQPHEVAVELVKYLVDENSFQPIELRWNTWEHQHIPEDVFDAYKGMRIQMSAYEGRKRTRGDSDPSAETPKRVRLVSPDDEIQLSEGLKARLGNNVRVKDGMAQVSIDKLEDLIGLVKDLKTQLDKKGEQVQGYAKFIRRFQPKYQDAIGDRGRFERERDKAIKDRDRAQKELERVQARVTKLAEEKHDLESKLRDLAQSKNPGQAAAAQREVALREAVDKTASVERQIKTIRADLDFAQSRYQDASDKAAALGEENNELKLQIRGLEARASDNVVQIRKINAARTDARLRQMYEQERAMRQSHEREIDRIKEELRTCKARFGGRETRGSSVPRSPRPSRQMSSRNTSPVGDTSNNGGGNGGNGLGGGNGNGGGGGGSGGGAMASVFGPRGSHLRDL